MILVKHLVHGNKHVDESEYPALKLEGWVKWPRTAAEKNAAPLSFPPPVVTPEVGAAPETVVADRLNRLRDLAGIRRKPGRPKKA